MDLVKVSNFSASYKDEEIKNLNFTVKEGEITGFTGTHDSGIEIVQRALNSKYDFYDGSIFILDKDISKDRNYLRDVTFYFNNTPFYENLTCKDHLLEVLSYRKYKKEYIQIIMDLLKLPKELLKKRGGKCNTYETHLFNLAIAFIPDSKLVIMEDPIPFFRVDEQELFVDFMHKLKEMNYSVLIFSQYSTNLEKFCDTMHYLDKGTLVSKNEYDINRKYEYDKRVETLKENGYADIN